MAANDVYPMWQFVISIIMSWFVITTLSMLEMKVLGTILKIFYFLYMMVLSVIFLMALTTHGGMSGLQLLVQVKFENIQFTEVIMLLCFSFRKLGMVVPTGYMTYSAYTKFSRFGPSTEALIIVLLNMLQTLYLLGLFYSIAGVHAMNLGIPIDATIVPYEGMYLAMLTEFLAFKKCPNLFLIVYYISSWILEVIKIAISKNCLVMNINDYYPQIRNFESYVRIAMGCIFCIMTLLFATEVFNVIYIPLILTGHSVVTISLEIFIQSTLVFYCYGVNRLSDDIQFVSGKRPIRYWIIMWYLLPLLSGVQLGLLVLNYKYKVIMDKDIIERNSEFNIITVGAIIGVVIIFMSLAISFLYIMLTFQQSKIAINVLKPQFLWGPPKTETRVARKLFAPRTAIRSQSNRKRKQRFRTHSIKQMREKDLAENVSRGRIFLDNMFFSEISLGARKVQVIIDENNPKRK